MAREFLDYYRDNLQFLRHSAQDFAAQFPKIARRLMLDGVNCKDPFVERVLEGTAFLCARVEKKLDEGYPRLLQTLLQQTAPYTLIPLPSCALVRPPQPLLNQLSTPKLKLPGGTRLRTKSAHSTKPLTFSTVTPTALRALTCQCRFEAQNREVPRAQGQPLLVLTLQAQGALSLRDLDLSALDLYLNLSDADASALSELLCHQVQAVMVKEPTGSLRPLELNCDYLMAQEPTNLFTQMEAAPGYQALLTLYSAYPQLFKFLRLSGLERAQLEGHQAELYLVFKHSAPNLSAALGPHALELNVLPLLNLFVQRIDRSPLRFDYEQHLSVDHSAPLDYEIVRTIELELIDQNNQTKLTLYPFFSAHSRAHSSVGAVGISAGAGGTTTDANANPDTNPEANRDASWGANFFAEHKRARLISSERALRRGYHKSETFVALSGPDFSALQGQELQLGGSTWCTNADLPLLLEQSARFEGVEQPKLTGLTLVSVPSAPQPPLIERLRGPDGANGADFAALAFTKFNLTAFLYDAKGDGTELLRALIAHYSVRSSKETQQLSACILKLQAQPHAFRFIEHGCVYFEHGFALELTLSEHALQGSGFYTMARLLTLLLLSLAPVNLPLSIELNTPERGKVVTWTSLTR